MLDRIVSKYIKDESKYTPEYINSIYSKVATIIQSTNLSPRLQMDHIDARSLPQNYKKLQKAFPEILKSRHSVYVQVADFNITAFLSALFIEDTISNLLITDERIPMLLYIDTPVLLADVGSIMDIETKGIDLQVTLGTSTEILYDLIYRADFVFWDKFDVSSLKYANRKLNDILSIRYNQCLGNMYFCRSNADNEIVDHFSLDLVQSMDYENGVYNLSTSDTSLVKLITEGALW